MPTNKTVIIGSNGQLGTDLMRCFDGRAVALTHADIEITNANQVVDIMRGVKPSVVLNTVGADVMESWQEPLAGYLASIEH